MNIHRIAVAGWCVALAFSSSIEAADVVVEWNQIMVTVVEDQPPPFQNRFAAITQLAVFEAVNAVTRKYKPYLGSISAPPGTSAEAAAIAAAHGVLRHFFPDRAAILDQARARSLAGIPEGAAKADGVAIGETAAVSMIAARANDGSEPPESYLPASSDPGEWQLTSDCPPAGGFFLNWRNVTPFAIRAGDQFRSDPPPTLSGSRYARDYNEVRTVGGVDSTHRPQDRATVVKVYAALSDAALWNPIAGQLTATHRHSLSQNARMFALLNMALSDAGVAVMDTKYRYNFWRPQTAIVAGASDGNRRTPADASFLPFIEAPCFPSYPSGHASTSYAAREVLENIFGRHNHSVIVSTAAVPGVTLQYKRLKEITADIDDARVYGGIHFRFDQEEGAEQGRELGAYVYRRSLRPLRGCECDDEAGSDADGL